MTQQPEPTPGKSLVPYEGQPGNGIHDQLVNDMKPYPSQLERAHSMKISVELPLSSQDSVFTGWDMKEAAENTLALSKWLHDFCKKHDQQMLQAKHKGQPSIITEFYRDLTRLRIAFSRASLLSADGLRNFFPAKFEMPFEPMLMGHASRSKSPEIMLTQLEALHKELTMLADFPADKKTPPACLKGIEEFREAVRRRLIPQVERAMSIETKAAEALEAQLPQGESYEQTTYKDGVVRKVDGWLETISKRPSSGHKRGA